MKKPNKRREVLLKEKREKKRFRRKRLRRLYNFQERAYYKEYEYKFENDSRIIKKFESPLFNFLIEKGFVEKSQVTYSKISIPKIFSLCDGYKDTMNTLSNLVSVIHENMGKEITIDFSDCEKVDQAALFVLQIIRIEFHLEFKKLDARLSLLKSAITYKTINSNNSDVNKMLLLNGVIDEVKFKTEGLLPINTVGYFKGDKSVKSYAENRKGFIASRIATYINDCLRMHEYEFSPAGLNDLDGLISEILNNAEDHSPFNTYYATANLMSEIKTDENQNIIAEMNLSFMNFGYSIYEGFEETSSLNSKVYGDMDSLYNQIKKGSLVFPFTKENIFTLYSLQEGVSRLKYKEASRGTGTMKFINSFFAFGDFEDLSRNYSPYLSILSGNTELICDNNYKPFTENDAFFVSLNRENDLRKPPEKSNLKSLKSNFPGTILSVRIYLNKEHLRKKYHGNDKKGD